MTDKSHLVCRMIEALQPVDDVLALGQRAKAYLGAGIVFTCDDAAAIAADRDALDHVLNLHFDALESV